MCVDDPEASMTDLADLLLWPDSVDAFYADRACSLRSDATRKTRGYTYRKLQRLHPGKPIGGFTTDDLVAFVTNGAGTRPGGRPSTATARNYRVALESLFGWAHHADRIAIGSGLAARPARADRSHANLATALAH
jgi:hypothetical protein